MADCLQTLLLLIVIPVVVYLSIKMGTFGFFRGRQLFHQHEEDGRNGKTKEEK